MAGIYFPSISISKFLERRTTVNSGKVLQTFRRSRVSIGRFLRPAEVRKSGPSMVTEILLPTFRRVIPVCPTLQSFPTGNARVHGLANLTRRGGGRGKREEEFESRILSRSCPYIFWPFDSFSTGSRSPRQLLDSSTSRTRIHQLPRVLATFLSYSHLLDG